VRLSLPNKHHFPVDMAPFGLPNDNSTFIAADRPYGLIEAIVNRQGAQDAPDLWPVPFPATFYEPVCSVD